MRTVASLAREEAAPVTEGALDSSLPLQHRAKRTQNTRCELRSTRSAHLPVCNHLSRGLRDDRGRPDDNGEAHCKGAYQCPHQCTRCRPCRHPACLVETPAHTPVGGNSRLKARRGNDKTGTLWMATCTATISRTSLARRVHVLATRLALVVSTHGVHSW